MNKILPRRLRRRQQRIERRLRPRQWEPQNRPMFRAGNLQYEMAERTRGFAYGGLGALHRLAQQTGLIPALDQELHLLKRHLPYHESDHVLNIAYNILCHGDCLEDLERLRNDEVYLDALGTPRIPDPTTAGDFCRRFSVQKVLTLLEIINRVRQNVWKKQPETFFRQAILEADGTIAETTGECKEGMDVSYKGLWGYHPLLLSLANTGEPLYLVNRSGNCTSSQSAAAYFDRAIDLCLAAGFREILLRGDTDFSQTEHLDRWDDRPSVRFVFGIDAMPNLVALAEGLPEVLWKPLHRPAKYEVRTEPRQRPVNVKERIVQERGYKNVRLRSEEVAEFEYRPTKCHKTYRIVALRKNLSVEQGQQRLFDEIRYFFYITNDRISSRAAIVHQANERCNQENLIEQLKNGVQAMRMPVDNLVSNWAYMVMASLAWTLKAWFALLLPAEGRWAQKYAAEKQSVLTLEFKRFRQAFIEVPCQIVKTGRRLVYRLLSWNRWLPVFFRGWQALCHGSG